MKNAKAVVAAVFVIALVLGFIQYQESETATPEPTTREKIGKALSKKGIIINDIMITTGLEAKKAFNVTDIPDDSKIAFVIFRAPPYNLEGDAYLEEHAKVIYETLDADSTIDGVLVWEISYARYSDTALILYADREKAEEVRYQNLTAEELINNFPLIEYSASKLEGSPSS
jgi:hypothetical protein